MTASKLATAAAAAAALVLAAGSAEAQQNIRTATSWPGGAHLEQFAQGFSKQADALTGGKVKFQIFPAGTIGSPLKITESVQKKVAQAGHTWPGYDWGIDKAAAIFGGYVGSPPAEALLHWIYAGGGIELWQQWRMEKFGVVALPCGAHSDEIHMHSRKPIRTLEDLKGLKLRTSGAWAEIANNARRLDRHPAGRARSIQRSSAASSTPSNGRRPGINIGLGFHKVAKYIILPGVHQPGAVLECVFDKALWDSFDATTKTQIEAAAKHGDAQFLDDHQYDGCRRAREAQGRGASRSSASTSPISTVSPRRPGVGGQVHRCRWRMVQEGGRAPARLHGALETVEPVSHASSDSAGRASWRRRPPPVRGSWSTSDFGGRAACAPWFAPSIGSAASAACWRPFW